MAIASTLFHDLGATGQWVVLSQVIAHNSVCMWVRKALQIHYILIITQLTASIYHLIKTLHIYFTLVQNLGNFIKRNNILQQKNLLYQVGEYLPTRIQKNLVKFQSYLVKCRWLASHTYLRYVQDFAAYELRGLKLIPILNLHHPYNLLI